MEIKNFHLPHNENLKFKIFVTHSVWAHSSVQKMLKLLIKSLQEHVFFLSIQNILKYSLLQTSKN